MWPSVWLLPEQRVLTMLPRALWPLCTAVCVGACFVPAQGVRLGAQPPRSRRLASSLRSCQAALWLPGQRPRRVYRHPTGLGRRGTRQDPRAGRAPAWGDAWASHLSPGQLDSGRRWPAACMGARHRREVQKGTVSFQFYIFIGFLDFLSQNKTTSKFGEFSDDRCAESMGLGCGVGSHLVGLCGRFSWASCHSLFLMGPAPVTGRPIHTKGPEAEFCHARPLTTRRGPALSQEPLARPCSGPTMEGLGCALCL